MKRMAIVTAAAILAIAGRTGMSAQDKGKKPRLDLRAIPRLAFSPVNIFLTAELMGGDDLEDYYCPELEWEWGDGGKSVHEADCPAFEPGVKIQRRFSAEHEFRRAGVYNVKVTLRRANRTVAANTVKVTVRPGIGDRSLED